MPASQKLSHLLQLADQGPAMRAALALDVAELLAGWPSDYPQTMRGVCEALLTKAARDVDDATRARVCLQLCGDPELSARVLGVRSSPTHALLAAARAGDKDGAIAELARAAGVDDATARRILSDGTGAALAAACKGAAIDRAAFSALALMINPGQTQACAFAVLDAFDRVAADQAIATLRGWRGQTENAA